MVFSNSQINDMLGILQKWEIVFIANQLGLEFLTQADINILLAAGINIDQYKNKKGVIEHAFLFGILSEAISDERAQKMDYAQFQRFLASGQFVPLTETEEFALQQVKNRAYTDITGLGNRVGTRIRNIALQNNQSQQSVVQNIIRTNAIDAVQFRMSASAFASNLGNATEDWERDWLRIAYYLTHEAFNSGRAQSILKQYGADAEVYFDVFPDACKWCKKIYLEDPDNEFSEPKIFKLKDIIANGNNIGRKADQWLPTISPTHPYCRCILNYKKPNHDWNPELRAYTILRKVKPKNPKLRNVKLDIKISK